MLLKFTIKENLLKTIIHKNVLAHQQLVTYTLLLLLWKCRSLHIPRSPGLL